MSTPDLCAAIVGTWQVVRAELGGQPMPADAAEHVELEFTAHTYTVRFGGESTDHGRYQLALEAEVPAIAMTGLSGENTGRTLPGIFQLVGDRLRICFALEGTVAPDAFAAPAGTLNYLATYRRKS